MIRLLACSVITNKKSVLGSGPLPLSDNPKTMDIPDDLYHETFDNIGEESFQPDYLESDDETEVQSTAGTSVAAPMVTNAISSTKCEVLLTMLGPILDWRWTTGSHKHAARLSSH